MIRSINRTKTNNNPLHPSTSNNHPPRYTQSSLPNITLPQTTLDNAFIGQPISSTKTPSTIRLLAININGFHIEPNGGNFHDFCSEIRNLEIDHCCISETHLNTLLPKTQQLCYDTLKQHQSHFRLTMASSQVPSDNTYKRGGTMSITTGDLTGRILQSKTDDMGRWVVTYLQGTKGLRVAIVCLYKPCNTSLHLRPNTAGASVLAQQSTMLRLRNIDTHPCQQFDHDLQTLLQTFEDDNMEYMIVGDFNESLDTRGSAIERLRRKFGLIDIADNQLSEEPFATYLRGTSRIDFILSTPRVADACTYIGYEPFNYRFQSDHRPLLVEFNTTILLGNELATLHDSTNRKLQSNNINSKKLYIKDRYRYLQEHRFFQRLQEVYERPYEPDKLESLDRDWTRSAIAAENNLKQYPTQAFSTQLQQARQDRRQLRRLLTAYKTGIDVEAGIAKDCQAQSTTLLPTSITECKEKYRQAQKYVKILEKSSYQVRRQELQQQLHQAQQAGDTEQTKALQHRLRSELTANMYSLIRRHAKPTHSALSSLQVPEDPDIPPEDCKEWRNVVLPDEIESLLHTRNKNHFGQADGTFPTTTPFKETVDWAASTHTAELILAGEYHDDTLESMSKLLLDHLQRPKFLDPETPTITLKQWTGKILKWKESTTTSPSGMHLGHYRAITKSFALGEEPTEEDTLLEQQRIQLLSAQLSMINMALKYAHSYDRWKTVTNVMIQKDLGVTKIHRLRVLHIYEADYNLLLGLKWRDAMQQSMHDCLIHPSQTATPGTDCLQAAFYDELQMDYTRMTRRPLAKISYDATSCYDRIVPNIAGLASRKHGVHKNVVKINADTLKQARYHLKTALGVTTSNYSHSDMTPIYGTGQGAGNSPQIWTFISNALFQAYEIQAQGATFFSPDGDTLHSTMQGFVDDVNGACTSDQLDLPTVQSLLARLQRDAQLWHDLLVQTGGAFNFKKLFIQIMYHQFTQAGMPILKSGSMGSITINTPNSPPKIIKVTNVYNSYRLLGNYTSPSAITKSSMRELQKINLRHIRTLTSAHLPPHGAQLYYYAVYLKSLTFSFPVSYYKPTQLRKLQNDFIRYLLPRCGYHRTMPDAVTFGPLELGGIGFHTFYTEQGIGQIRIFLKHWRTNTDTSAFLRINLQWAQLTAGVSFPILDSTKTPLPHLECQWMKSMRYFLSTFNGSIELDNNYTINPRRRYDTHIMDVILDSQQFTPVQIKTLNACRLFLNVHTLSDLTTPRGDYLDKSVLAGQPSLLAVKSTYVPIVQPRPNRQAWRLWKIANRLWSDRTNKLLQPLGAWLSTPADNQQLWPSYYSRRTSILYQVHDHEFHTYPSIGHLKNTIHSQQTVTFTDIPNDAVPVEVLWTRNHIEVKLHHSRSAIEQQSQPHRFIERLRSLDEWEASLFHRIFLMTTPRRLCNVLIDGSIGVSDGSITKKGGSFAWVISTKDGQPVAQCAGPVYGSDKSSFRAEGYGLLSLLRFLIRIYEHQQMNLPHMMLYSDNSGLISKIESVLYFPYFYPNSTQDSDWDVIQSIVTTVREFPKPPDINHVKGHQDDNIPYDDLPLEAKLNVDADLLANQYLIDYPESFGHVPLIKGNKAQLNIAGNTHTHHITRAIRQATTTPTLQAYIRQKWDLTEEHFDNVCWKPHRQAIKRHHHNRKFIVKLLHRLLPTGTRLRKYSPTYDTKCPSCDYPDEDWCHIFKCPCPKRQQWRDRLKTRLKDKCTQLKVNSAVSNLLVGALMTWFNDLPIHTTAYPPNLTCIISGQENLGWCQLILGRFHTAWQGPLPNQVPVSSNPNWIREVIDVLWESAMTLWTMRNEDKHGATLFSKRAAKRQQAERETKHLYESRDKVLPRDENLFFPTIDDHFTTLRTYSQLRQWLHVYRPVILQSIIKRTTQSHSGVRPIYTYFRPIT